MRLRRCYPNVPELYNRGLDIDFEIQRLMDWRNGQRPEDPIVGFGVSGTRQGAEVDFLYRNDLERFR